MPGKGCEPPSRAKSQRLRCPPTPRPVLSSHPPGLPQGSPPRVPHGPHIHGHTPEQFRWLDRKSPISYLGDPPRVCPVLTTGRELASLRGAAMAPCTFPCSPHAQPHATESDPCSSRCRDCG